MIIVHYEVYVLEGRGWMLHARFPRTERETAISEAKELEQTLSMRVRVLRETYYTDDNSFEESEIYASAGVSVDRSKAPPQAPRPQASARSGAPTPRPSGSRTAARPVGTARPAPRSKKSEEETAQARQLFARLVAITALALAVALLSIKITPNAIMLLWKLGFNLTVTPDSYGKMLFAVFVATFLMVAVPLCIRFLPRQTAIPEFRKPTFSWGGGSGPAPSEDPERDRAVKKSLNKLAAQALAQEEQVAQSKDGADLDEDDDPDEDKARERDKKAADIAVDDLDLPEILPGPDTEALPEIRPDPEETPPAKPDDAWDTVETPQTDRAGKEKQDPEQQDKDKKAGKKDEGTSAESLEPSVMRFLDGAVAQAKVLVPNMDAFTKFALHLYIAGAVEALCDFKKLGESAKTKLVSLALETLGTRGDLARKFYEKIEEYLMEPRYLGVVQAGRDAMGDFMLGDEGGAHRALRDAFLEWTRKSDKKAQIVTVMFTDMVGSTDMTQARGDAAAQEVVRRHNSIVRNALAQFGGKEIKHTGDGIMASFGTAAAAVEAAVSIQRQVNQHNGRLPNQALHLRIGLNAGEPIEEEDDLFGATVQLAARVCNATNADQILCTAVVKDLTVGKGAGTFRPVGEKWMKGFKDAVALFEVQWK